MKPIKNTLAKFQSAQIDKPTFIQSMYEDHHAALFDYANYLAQTNVKKIEIEDESVIMTSRDRGIRIACAKGDFRIAPIETLNFFDYEKAESDMMENLIVNGDNFFDIGTNIGWYSINIAAAQRDTTVYSFEPIPTTYEQFQRNIMLNGISNIKPHNFGLSDKPGEFPFYFYAEGSGNASSANLTNRDDVECVQCQVSTLDHFTNEAKVAVDFIKCDVEGGELLVFKGGEQTIRQYQPIVFSEILRKWSAKFDYDPNEIFAFFKSLGYRAFTVKGPYLQAFDRMDASTIETNFFFLHTEKHHTQIQQYEAKA